VFGRGSKPAFLIVGLGNPGPSYARTRHNAGAELVEKLAAELGASFKRGRAQARTAEATLEGETVALAIPTTYVNESGRAVARLARKESVKPERIVIVHDELDLAPGVARLKAGGGTAGHNGLRSIEASLRSRDFLRLRIGVGKPPSKEEGADHVLSKLTPQDRKLIDEAIDRGIEALHVLARDDFDAAQNLLHAPT
jgi:PTH1 family peptidyl-tRNA hydrolase